MNDAVQQVDLRPVWRAMLGILDEFVKVCEKYSLRYYLTDGTAIGAVRHKGFIPWDDDIDVSMPREDYDRFVEIAAQELPSHLKFVNWENTPELPLLFGKIQDSREDYVRKVEKESGEFLSGGLFVDIFPIDGYPESNIERVWVKLIAIPMSFMVRFRCMRFREQSAKGKIVWIVGAVLSVMMPWVSGQSCKQRCEGFLRRHSYAGSEFTGRAGFRLTLLHRPPLPKRCWGEGKLLPFCQTQYRVPEDYDTYLRHYYGDYMVLPPVESRCPSHQYSWRCPWWLGPTMPNIENNRK